MDRYGWKRVNRSLCILPPRLTAYLTFLKTHRKTLWRMYHWQEEETCRMWYIHDRAAAYYATEVKVWFNKKKSGK